MDSLLDVAIIGGGLAGCVVAYGIEEERNHRQQQRSSCSWMVFDARTVLGGRLVNDRGGKHIDMGGAWIWPGSQPIITNQILNNDRLGLKVFPQPDDCNSVRIDGGAIEIINALVKTLPSDRLRTNTPIASCRLVQVPSAGIDDNSASPNATDDEKQTTSVAVVELKTTTGQIFFARRVVIAVPPRLVYNRMNFEPSLSPKKWSAMANSNTWMAGVTKVALVYREKFWNSSISNMGFPPDDDEGPAFQVYDSSTCDGSIAALTFFALVENDGDDDSADDVLANRVANQLGNRWSSRLVPRYFNDGRPDDDDDDDLAEQAKNFIDHYVQRWPLEQYLSENPKPTRINPHPSPTPILSEPEWNGKLVFAGTETDRNNPGMMEGAVGSALRAIKYIIHNIES